MLKNIMNVYKKISGYSDELGTHCKNTAHLADAIARSYGMHDGDVFTAGLLHDIGKTTIPQDILYKEGKLSETEKMCIDMHVVSGYQMLKAYGMSKKLCQMVLFHHGTKLDLVENLEQPDADTLFKAQIVSVADAFDALTTKRCYHEARTTEESIAIMREMSFNQLIVDRLEGILNGTILCPERKRA